MTSIVFPFSEDTPAQFRETLPASADVVIIGGGVLGITTALFLARRGVSVVVLEKGRVAGEQSSRNWGWIRQQGRDADELPIMVEALRLWKELERDCGEDIGLRQTGVTYLARTDKEMVEFEDFVRTAQALDVDTRLLDPAQTDHLIPGMARRYRGALTTSSDMRAEPWVAVPALARLARREGATIVEHCSARLLDLGAGRVCGIWTEAGRIATSTVLVAGGAWSSLFLRAHGVDIPQLSVKATVAVTAAMPEIYEGAATDEDIAFRRRQDGGYTLAAGGASQLYVGPDAIRHMSTYLPAFRAHPFSTRLSLRAPLSYPDAWSTARRWEADEESPFERLRILDPLPDRAILRKIDRRFRRLFPQFRSLPIHKSWAGMIDAMPDFVPIVDKVASIPGLMIATGMSGHGFGIGPGMGRVLADLVQGNDPGHRLDRFRLSRFGDGTPLRLGPAI